MNYHIEEKEAFTFYGIKREFSTENGENFIKIPQFWDDVLGDGSFEAMISKAKGNRSLGVCMPMEPNVDTNFDYVIGGFCDGAVEGYELFEVPAAKWAVFSVEGPVNPNLQEAWQEIFSGWLPKSAYHHAPLPELEVYDDGDPMSEENVTEIWIPIIDK